MRRISPRSVDVVALVVAIAHGLMAFTAANTKSPTFDEPVHFAAGYSYWLRHDFRLDAESGILPQRWATLPLLISQPAFPAIDSPAWQSADQGQVGTQFLYDLGNDANALLRKGRAMMSLVSAALCLLVYFWSKELFGPIGGLISAIVAAFCPTLLAHGPLVTSDVSLAFFTSAGVWSTWRMLQRPTVARVLLSSLCVAGAILAKISGALIVLMLLALLIVWLLSRSYSRRRLFGLLAIAPAVYVSIWAAYDFRYAANTQDVASSTFTATWARLLTGNGFVTHAIHFARDRHLLPEAYLYGLGYVRASAQLRPAFLDGNWSVIGFADFFPRAFLYKTPLPLLGLLLLSATAVILAARAKFASSELTQERMRRLVRMAMPLWVLLGIYGAFAIGARLNIGHRHILPLYPPLFVACGASAVYFRRSNFRGAAVAVIGLIIWHIGESLAVRPDYLAYFSEVAGGSSRGYQHLVDSSLDWGQDLPTLRDQVRRFRERDQRPIYLAYFGTAKPAYYGIDAVPLPATFTATDLPIVELRGGLYCISATSFQQVYTRAMGPWCARYEQLYQQLRKPAARFEQRVTGLPNEKFESPAANAAQLNQLALFNQLRFARLCAALRQRRPSITAGHSILLFDLSDQDLEQALNGPPAELFPRVDVAGLE